MGKVVLKRPDGSILEVDEKDSEELKHAFGYKDEAEEERSSRNAKASYESYYSGLGQRIKTGIEGLTSGLTAGGSDKLLQWATDAGITGDEWRARAEVNPGTRLGTEIIGAVGPALFSGGAITPAGAITEGEIGRAHV